MADRRSSALFESPLVRVFDVCCRVPQSGRGEEEWGGVAQVVLPRRGVFVVHRRSDQVVADSNTALILGADDEYSVSHPGVGGDDCTVLVAAPWLFEEAVGKGDRRHAHLTPSDRLALSMITRALQEKRYIAPIEAEEASLLLLNAVGRAFADFSTGPGRIRPAQRARVEHARALLASAPARHWGLAAVARAVHCSPYHLARQFRAVTGETISRYLLHLRLGLALERLAGGDRQLGRLALELGFSHHSHFTLRFGTAFGLTPAEVRDVLTQPRLREVRTIVTAQRA